ncbi:MAG: hypothetical protein KME55_30185 [Nostoc indistinguendum CM1-VF10]|jgi:hypothetical protein|nr:hypothetical protein [Nostoc indistinguendum CM1-VF10]
MEPLSTAAIAIGSVVATKALEKTGEKVGDVLWDKTGKFLVSLKKQSPRTVVAIEKALEEPIDYGEAVLQVNSAAGVDPNVKLTMQELAAATETNPPSNLAEFLGQIKEAVKKSQHPFTPAFSQNIQKAINAAQTQTIDQRGSTFNV